MKNKEIILTFVLWVCLFSIAAMADDAEQYLPDTLEESPLKDTKIDLKKNYVIPDQAADEFKNKKINNNEKEINFLPDGQQDEGIKKAVTEQEEISSTGVLPLGSHAADKAYLEHSNKEILSSMRKSGNKDFSFMFYDNEFNYSNSSNNFNNIFRSDTSDRIRASHNNSSITQMDIMIRFSGHQFLSRGFFDFGIGMGIGAGHNSGLGSFSGTEKSGTKITLWTVPVDLSFILQTPITSYFKISGTGGPSAVGLIQSRNDLDSSDKRKNMNQVGYGYFAAGRFDINLSKFFSRQGVGLFSDYTITQYFLSFEMRQQYYANFKSDDLKISGTSFGIGMNFEYF